MSNLQGKTVLVTAAGQGIGRASALALSSLPYRSATKKATLCAMRGVSVSVQTTQNASLGQRSEAVAVSKERGLLSAQISKSC